MKTSRQNKILELIHTNKIQTQDELSSFLEKTGYKVTQATVSRDIRELNLMKMADEDGTFIYHSYQKAVPESKQSEKFIRVFSDAAKSIDFAGNIIIIKTMQGMAMAVAAAVDSMNISGIMGCIAGDDTIFCCVKSENDAVGIIKKLKPFLS